MKIFSATFALSDNASLSNKLKCYDFVDGLNSINFSRITSHCEIKVFFYKKDYKKIDNSSGKSYHVNVKTS